MGKFGGFSLPRRLRGVIAVAKGDREDCNGGETGESLFLLADRLAEVGMSCGSEHPGSDNPSSSLPARETLTKIICRPQGLVLRQVK